MYLTQLIPNSSTDTIAHTPRFAARCVRTFSGTGRRKCNLQARVARPCVTWHACVAINTQSLAKGAINQSFYVVTCSNLTTPGWCQRQSASLVYMCVWKWVRCVRGKLRPVIKIPSMCVRACTKMYRLLFYARYRRNKFRSPSICTKCAQKSMDLSATKTRSKSEVYWKEHTVASICMVVHGGMRWSLVHNTLDLGENDDYSHPEKSLWSTASPHIRSRHTEYLWVIDSAKVHLAVWVSPNLRIPRRNSLIQMNQHNA